MKKAFLLLFSLALLCLIFCAPALAETSGSCGEDLTWTLTDSGKLTISGTGPMTDYVGSQYSPFRGNTDIKQVVIQPGVTTIGDNAFINCSELWRIEMPEGLTSIGRWAFWNCSDLWTPSIPKTVTQIKEYAFRDCSNMSSFTFPQNVTVVSNRVLLNCTKLETVTLPDGLVTIEQSAFQGCSSLKSVALPASATASCGKYAFMDCSSLTDIVIPSGNTTIGDGCFAYCTSLKNVVIPDTLTVIGPSAFYDCTSLTRLTLLETVTSIGSNAFGNCAGLTVSGYADTAAASYCGSNGIPFNAIERKCGEGVTWTLSGGVLTLSGQGPMKDYTYSDHSPFWERATTISQIRIGSGITRIGSYAFVGCSGVTRVYFDSGSALTSVGTNAFWKCSGLSSFPTPGGVQSIEESAFHSCSGLASISLPSGLKTLGNYAFRNCSELVSISIPDSVTSMGIQVFTQCTSLRYVSLPSGLTVLPMDIFWNCTSLRFIKLPDTLTRIRSGAFHASGLLEIKLPANVTSIDYNAFASCASLERVYIPAADCAFGTDVFKDCTDLTLYGQPDSTVQAYADSQSIPFKSLAWSQPDFLLPAGLTRIEDYAFCGVNAKVIYIPDGVTYIGGDAFAECANLEKIRFPDTITSWNVMLFGSNPPPILVYGGEKARDIAAEWDLFYAGE